MKLLNMLLTIGIAIVVLYAAACIYVFFAQSQMVFYPTSTIAVTPTELKLGYEDVRIEQSPEEIVHGWYLTAADSTDLAGKTVLFCHGNAGNLSHRMQTAVYLLDMGVNVLMFDYRGYGQSTGSPTEENVHADALAAYQWLVSEKSIRPVDITVFGRSLGGAVAVDLAGRVTVGGLIVESSFTSVHDMGRKLFPYLPVKFLIRYDFNSLEKIRNVTVPVLITHSPDDDMIPYSMGERLFEAAGEPKLFCRLSGLHNERDYFNNPEYKAALRKTFLGASASQN
jgi:fermentation-respiration switch protein FrsA (DUF1100 family)